MCVEDFLNKQDEDDDPQFSLLLYLHEHGRLEVDGEVVDTNGDDIIDTINDPRGWSDEEDMYEYEHDVDEP